MHIGLSLAGYAKFFKTELLFQIISSNIIRSEDSQRPFTSNLLFMYQLTDENLHFNTFEVKVNKTCHICLFLSEPKVQIEELYYSPSPFISETVPHTSESLCTTTFHIVFLTKVWGQMPRTYMAFTGKRANHTCKKDIQGRRPPTIHLDSVCQMLKAASCILQLNGPNQFQIGVTIHSYSQQGEANLFCEFGGITIVETLEKDPFELQTVCECFPNMSQPEHQNFSTTYFSTGTSLELVIYKFARMTTVGCHVECTLSECHTVLLSPCKTVAPKQHHKSNFISKDKNSMQERSRWIFVDLSAAGNGTSCFNVQFAAESGFCPDEERQLHTFKIRSDIRGCFKSEFSGFTHSLHHMFRYAISFYNFGPVLHKQITGGTLWSEDHKLTLVTRKMRTVFYKVQFQTELWDKSKDYMHQPQVTFCEMYLWTLWHIRLDLKQDRRGSDVIPIFSDIPSNLFSYLSKSIADVACYYPQKSCKIGLLLSEAKQSRNVTFNSTRISILLQISTQTNTCFLASTDCYILLLNFSVILEKQDTLVLAFPGIDILLFNTKLSLLDNKHNTLYFHLHWVTVPKGQLQSLTRYANHKNTFPDKAVYFAEPFYQLHYFATKANSQFGSYMCARYGNSTCFRENICTRTKSRTAVDCSQCKLFSWRDAFKYCLDTFNSNLPYFYGRAQQEELLNILYFLDVTVEALFLALMSKPTEKVRFETKLSQNLCTFLNTQANLLSNKCLLLILVELHTVFPAIGSGEDLFLCKCVDHM